MTHESVNHFIILYITDFNANFPDARGLGEVAGDGGKTPVDAKNRFQPP